MSRLLSHLQTNPSNHTPLHRRLSTRGATALSFFSPHNSHMTDIATLTLNPTIDRSASIDKVVPDKKLHCHGERFDPGGGGINVAAAITKLGGQAIAFWTCGGPVGELLKDLLGSRGMQQSPISIEQNTRENVIIYEEHTEQQFRFGMPGPELTEQEQQNCLETVAKLDPVPRFLVLSGSLPPGVPEDFYGQLIATAPDSTKVVLDTRGPALKKGIEQEVFLIKPNQRELGDLAGQSIESDAEAHDAARRLIDKDKVEAVLLSLGRGGVMLVSREEHHRIAAPTVSIRSKIGAGDSTVAGTVLALQRGSSLYEAAQFGVACGTAAVMTAGTELCRREDAEKLFQEIAAEAQHA